MNSSSFRVRRATLDDIGQLTEMWKTLSLPVEELSKRVTEFQVADTLEGKVLGALGMQITEHQGRIHSECFSDFGLSEQLRPLLWDRLHSVATNHGLLRLWTQENAPFWKHCGLNKPDAEAMTKLPAPWRSLQGEWLTLKLKDDLESVISLDKEFAVFMEAQKQETQRAFQQAKFLKMLATLLAFGLLILVIAGAFILIKRNPQFLNR